MTVAGIVTELVEWPTLNLQHRFARASTIGKLLPETKATPASTQPCVIGHVKPGCNMTAPSRLIGSGRSADIYEYGAGRVLRRSGTTNPLSADSDNVEMDACADIEGRPCTLRVERADDCVTPIVDNLAHN